MVWLFIFVFLWSGYLDMQRVINSKFSQKHTYSKILGHHSMI